MKHTAGRFAPVGVALFGLLVAGCSGGSGTGSATASSAAASASAAPVTITYIVPTSWANGDALKANVAAYEKKSGNKVTLQAVPDEKYDGIVQARLAAGSGIDVFAGQDKVVDPASIMIPVDGPWVGRLVPSIKAAITKPDGKIYGVPAFDPAHTTGFLYNKDVFTKAGVTAAPKTLAEVADAFAKVKTAGVTPFYVSAADGWTLLQHRTAVLANAQGADPGFVAAVDGNKVQVSAAPGYREEFGALADWVAKGYTNKDALTATYDKAVAAVASGQAGALFNGTWSIGDLTKSNAKANIGFFPLPAAEGKTSIALYDPSLIKIAKSSKVQDAAKGFLAFLAEKQQATTSLDAQPGVAVFTDVKLTTVPPAFADVQAVVDSGAVVRGFDNASSLPALSDPMISAYQQLIGGKVDVTGFLALSDKAWAANGKQAKAAGF